MAPVFLSEDGASDRPEDADAARDARLVENSLKNPDDFRHLVRLHQDRVYATALRLLRDPAEAEDVTQDAFLRAFRSLKKFERGRRFSPWVCTIAANLARDRLRRPFHRLRSLFEPKEEAAPDAPPTAGLEREDRIAELESRLDRLKPRLREAIVLRYVSGMSVDEVAVALGISTSAAKMRLKRGLEQLQD
jgi:RNA polymerase sigma-70 factor (ECF subfamily)